MLAGARGRRAAVRRAAGKKKLLEEGSSKKGMTRMTRDDLTLKYS
jgi:hypothetical protein